MLACAIGDCTISVTKYFDWKNNCLFVARFVTC